MTHPAGKEEDGGEGGKEVDGFNLHSAVLCETRQSKGSGV